jgi:hypothetical protein
MLPLAIRLSVTGFLVWVPSLLGAPSAEVDIGEPAVLRVIGEDLGPCECEYFVDQQSGPNNAACVTVTFVVLPGEAAKCKATNCNEVKDCKRDFRIITTINNWGACCSGAMVTCLNGAPDQIIPHNFAGAIETTVEGTPLACQAHADSSENLPSIDNFVVVCGNSCDANQKCLYAFREHCYHCSAGGG